MKTDAATGHALPGALAVEGTPKPSTGISASLLNVTVGIVVSALTGLHSRHRDAHRDTPCRSRYWEYLSALADEYGLADD